jgi:hypothetical protein
MQLTVAREPAVAYLPGRDPAHALHARRQARALLQAWELSEHADLGELIASELVTNALCHGDGPIWMQMSFARGDLRGLRRPGPVMAGAALVTSPSGPAPGSRQHAARLRAWRVPAQAGPPACGLQERVAAGAW